MVFLIQLLQFYQLCLFQYQLFHEFLFSQNLAAPNLYQDPVLVAGKVQPSSDYLYHDMGCSVIYASDGEVALGGNNEDYQIPITMACC